MTFRPDDPIETSPDWHTYVPTGELIALQMTQPFAVETVAGPMEFGVGDYLVRGADGLLCGMTRRAFEDSHRRVA